MHFIKLFQPIGKSFSLFLRIARNYVFEFLKPFNTTGITNKGTSPYDGVCWKVVHSSFIKELRLKSRFTSSYGDFGGIKAIWIINNCYLQL